MYFGHLPSLLHSQNPVFPHLPPSHPSFPKAEFSSYCSHTCGCGAIHRRMIGLQEPHPERKQTLPLLAGGNCPELLSYGCGLISLSHLCAGRLISLLL